MCVPSGGSDDGGVGAGVWGVVLPLPSPFRRRLRRWGGCGGSSSGALVCACSSGRPWRRGEERAELGVPVLLALVLVVSFGVSAPAGRGGGGSGIWRWVGAGGGWPMRRPVGWKWGGAVEVALGSCSFIASRCRRAAADEACGLLQSGAALPPWRIEVRRRRRSLGFLGAGEGSV